MIDDGLKATVADEESRYRHTLLRQHLHDVDWLEAIILMKQGKWQKPSASWMPLLNLRDRIPIVPERLSRHLVDV